MPLCSRSRQLTSYVCPFLVFLLLAPWPGRPFRSAQLTAEQGWSNIGSFSKLQASHGSSRLASAQGLRASDENLGASERAGLDSLSQFEVLLELSDDFTGGRNTGGRRPGRQKGGRNGGVYVDSQSLRQQQLELYHVAGMIQSVLAHQDLWFILLMVVSNAASPCNSLLSSYGMHHPSCCIC